MRRVEPNEWDTRARQDVLASPKAQLIRRVQKTSWQIHKHPLRTETTSTDAHHFKHGQIALDSKFNASVWSATWLWWINNVLGNLQLKSKTWHRKWKRVKNVLKVNCICTAELCFSAITGAAEMEVTPLLQDSFSGWEGLLGTSFFGHGTNSYGKSN